MEITIAAAFSFFLGTQAQLGYGNVDLIKPDLDKTKHCP